MPFTHTTPATLAITSRSDGTAARVTLSDAMREGERRAMLWRHSVARERNIEREIRRELM
jgi:hypothetical protein